MSRPHYFSVPVLECRGYVSTVGPRTKLVEVCVANLSTRDAPENPLLGALGLRGIVLTI